MKAGEEEEDLEAIQAHLDMTMALTYAAVEAAYKNSTLPDDMVYETIESFKPRPPRLGVGATPRNAANGTNSTTMARETARLHGRLAGKKRGREDLKGDGIEDASTHGLKRLHIQSDSEEAESRATTIANKEREKGKGRPPDKFAVKSKQKSKGPNTSENATGAANASDTPATSGTRKINPSSAGTPSDDTRFVVPPPPKPSSTTGRPRASSTSTPGGGLYSPPQSPPRLLSPVISLSRSRSSSTSHTSRHSSMSLSRRMMLKQQANALWRIVSVDPVSPQAQMPMSPLSPRPVEQTDTSGKSPTRGVAPNPSNIAPESPASHEKSKKQPGNSTGRPPVLQLGPIEPSNLQGDGPLEGGANNDESSTKKKKRRRRKRKKHSETAPLQKVDEEAGDDGESE